MLLRMISYIRNEKKIPMDIQHEILTTSEWSCHLIPQEDVCLHCKSAPLLSPPILITKHAKIISLTRVVTGKFIRL